MSIFEKISKDKKLKATFRKKFNKIIDEVGEIQLVGNVSTDYILAIFNHQGHWSLFETNINYSEENGFYTTKRIFG